MLNQYMVGGIPPQSVPDLLAPVAALGGKAGEGIVAELHGKFYTQNYRGYMYDYGTPLAGVTLTTTGSTTQTFGIFNPAGSNRLIIPTKCRVGLVGPTGTVTALAWCTKTGLGASVAGTSPFATATFVTALNANTSGQFIGGVGVGKLFSTCTLDAAPTIKRWFGASWGAPLSTTAAIFPMLVDEFDGDTIIGPGSALFLAGATSPGAATDVSLTWYEAPV